MKIGKIIAISFVLLYSMTLFPHVPKGGLGDVAISPDGKTIVAGGDTRVLYIIDPASLQVKDRVWIKTNIYEMEFNKDGSVLVVEDSSESLHFIGTKDWEIIKTIKKSGRMSAVPAVDLLAGVTPGFRKSTVKFISMSDGSVKGQFEFPAKVLALGLDAQAKKLVMIAQGPKDKEEKKPAPKNLNRAETAEFRQKHDGKVSILAEFEVPSGKKLSEKTIFYSANNPRLLVGQKAVFLVDYSNVNARIEGDNITLFTGKSSYNYGLGVSPAREAVLMGGLRKGTTMAAGTMEMKTFDIEQLPGWPEYYKGFGFAADGTGYGVTTAYRLVKIDMKNGTATAVPIY